MSLFFFCLGDEIFIHTETFRQPLPSLGTE